MQTPDDSVHRGRFADLRSRSHSSRSHTKRADGGGGGWLEAPVVADGSGCARRWSAAFATALSTGTASIRREVWIGIGPGWKTASREAESFGSWIVPCVMSERRNAKQREARAAGIAASESSATDIWDSAVSMASSRRGDLHFVVRLETACTVAK